jgi:hypothetical protein
MGEKMLALVLIWDLGLDGYGMMLLDAVVADVWGIYVQR